MDQVKTFNLRLCGVRGLVDGFGGGQEIRRLQVRGQETHRRKLSQKDKQIPKDIQVLSKDCRSDQRDNFKRFKDEGRCFKCHERGHRAFDCKEGSREKRRSEKKR